MSMSMYISPFIARGNRGIEIFFVIRTRYTPLALNLLRIVTTRLRAASAEYTEHYTELFLFFRRRLALRARRGLTSTSTSREKVFSALP